MLTIDNAVMLGGAVNNERHDKSYDNTEAERSEEARAAQGSVDEVRANEPEPASGGTDGLVDAWRDANIEGRDRTETAHSEITAQVIAAK